MNVLNLRKLRRSVRRFFSWFPVYAEFRIRRLWFFLRYGGVKNMPPEALRKHFDKQFKIISKELAETDKKLPELMEDIWRHGNERSQERATHLLRESAELDESFERMKQTAEILLKAAAKEAQNADPKQKN